MGGGGTKYPQRRRETDSFLWCQFGEDPQISFFAASCEKGQKEAEASLGFGNKSVRRFGKHGSDLQPRAEKPGLCL